MYIFWNQYNPYNFNDAGKTATLFSFCLIIKAMGPKICKKSVCFYCIVRLNLKTSAHDSFIQYIIYFARIF